MPRKASQTDSPLIDAMEPLADYESAASVLKQFLSFPLDDSTPIFQMFLQLPGAVQSRGRRPMERFVYVPGAREDRVLLIAHTDTVWDAHYKNPVSAAVLEEKDGYLCSGSPSAGIGADDRAGCAALWLLRNSGHSLLLADGEEYRHWGARYLLRTQRRLLRELNRHCYLVELDLPGSLEYSFKGVAVTKRFERFIQQQGYRQTACKGGTDLRFLSRGRCGVNLSIGFYRQHTPREVIAARTWYENCRQVHRMLQPRQTPYPWSFFGFLKLSLRAILNKGKRGLQRLWKHSSVKRA